MHHSFNYVYLWDFSYRYVLLCTYVAKISSKLHTITSVGMGASKSNETRYSNMVMSEFRHMTTSFFTVHPAPLMIAVQAKFMSW